MSYRPTFEEYYPIFKEICQETNIVACELNYICFLSTNGLLLNGEPIPRMNTQGYINQEPPIYNIEIKLNLPNILKSMIATDSAIKREQNKRTNGNPPLETTI